ncbi:MAG: DUF4861 family protein, partial [Bacteroidota bacterium]
MLKSNFYLFVLSSLLVIACGSRQELSDSKSSSPLLGLSINNTASFERIDEPISLKRADIEEVLGNLPSGETLLVQDENEVVIPSQIDDIDMDGNWDELAFVVSLSPQESKRLIITLTTLTDNHAHKNRTNIRFAHNRAGENDYTVLEKEVRPVDHSKQNNTGKYQMEGPAWENDIVAFRLYFDSRNGKDIFGKKTSEMVLDSVGIVGNYHELQDWGMDILKVNNSLGAGAIAMYEDNQLYRLTGCDTIIYKKIFEGPIRSRLRLSYSNWNVNDHNYGFKEEITIWAGQSWYESQLTLSGFEGETELVTGIVNIYSDSASFRNYQEKAISLSTHAPQAFTGEYLGMGVLAKTQDFAEYGKAPDNGKGVTETDFIRLKAFPEKPVAFRFFAGWEFQDKGYADYQY